MLFKLLHKIFNLSIRKSPNSAKNKTVRRASSES